MSDYEVKPVNTKGNEKRKTIPKPFRRQKQSVEDRDREDGCDYVPENTKLLNDNQGNDTQDKDDRFIDNIDNVHSIDTQDQIDIRNHLLNKSAEVCEDHMCTPVTSDASAKSKRRRIAFTTSNGRSIESKESSGDESQLHPNEESQQVKCCSLSWCHKEQCENESFQEKCSRHVL